MMLLAAEGKGGLDEKKGVLQQRCTLSYLQYMVPKNILIKPQA